MQSIKISWSIGTIYSGRCPNQRNIDYYKIVEWLNSLVVIPKNSFQNTRLWRKEQVIITFVLGPWRSEWRATSGRFPICWHCILNKKVSYVFWRMIAGVPYAEIQLAFKSINQGIIQAKIPITFFIRLRCAASKVAVWILVDWKVNVLITSSGSEYKC